MDYLIDTHVALWWWANDSKLSQTARDLLLDSDNMIYFSAISVYEILLKHRLGKLQIPSQLVNHLADEIDTEGWLERPLSLAAASMAAQFDQAHRDPFDRMIAAQCITSNLPLISIDSVLDTFGVNRIW